MTYHLLFPALALLLAVSTVTFWTQARNVTQFAYAHSVTASPLPGRGFAGAFGNGEALRNLLYAN